MPKTDERIDLYIAKSADFAQPVLNHLRKLVHTTCPKVEETIKWGFPHFEYAGGILCSMASFKAHCGFSFWKANIMEDPHGVLSLVGKTSMGSFGHLHHLSDLPSDKIIKEYIKEAMRLNEENIVAVKAKKAPSKKAATMPDYFAAALKKNKKAAIFFEGFSPSAKKEYIEWLEDAKTETTRNKRMANAIEWIAEGKQRHWKYQQ